jgi:hypothetical protein
MIVENSVSDTHYTSIDVDALYLRDLPGVPEGGRALIGLSARGILPGGQTLRTVSAVEMGRDGIELRNPWRIGAFRFLGEELSLEIRVAPLDHHQFSTAQGVCFGSAEVLRIQDPHHETKVKMANSVFERLFPQVPGKKSWTWEHEIRLRTAVGRHDPAATPLLVGTNLIAFLFPGDTPPGQSERVNMRTLTSQLTLQGSVVRWKTATEGSYRASPYILLRITRHDRLPGDFDFRKEGERAEDALRKRKPEEALRWNETALRSLAEIRQFTAREATLERRKIEARTIRIQRAMADLQGDGEKSRSLSGRLARELGAMLKDLHSILTPGEQQEANLAMQEAKRAAAAP